jgi:nucleoside-diphosphate-sugar epimerase
MSKYKGEKVVFEYGAKGMEVNTVHPTLIYGPRETNTLAPLMRTYLHPPIRFRGYVDSMFDFVYVEDVAEGHIAAMEHGVPGERYILGGEERSIGEFLGLLDELTGTRKPVITVPRSVVEFGTMKIDPLLDAIGINLPIQRDQVHAMRTDTVVDNSKMREELCVEITTLREGLAEHIAWLQERDLLDV